MYSVSWSYLPHLPFPTQFKSSQQIPLPPLHPQPPPLLFKKKYCCLPGLGCGANHLSLGNAPAAIPLKNFSSPGSYQLAVIFQLEVGPHNPFPIHACLLTGLISRCEFMSTGRHVWKTAFHSIFSQPLVLMFCFVLYFFSFLSSLMPPKPCREGLIFAQNVLLPMEPFPLSLFCILLRTFFNQWQKAKVYVLHPLCQNTF